MSTDEPIPGLDRRRFIQCLAVTAGSLGAAGMALGDGGAPLVSLRAAGYRFPRFEALFNGSVSVEGCDTQFEQAGIGDINTNIFSGAQTWDFAEIGLHPYMLAWANEGFRDYTLLPIFPLRIFRHKSIFIRTDRGIRKPSDLRGKTIGAPGYSSTSLTWIRGLLQDEYGVSPNDVQWVISRKDSSAGEAGKISAQENQVPEGVKVALGPAGVDESDLLLRGEVDALFHAATPRAFVEGEPGIARLFPDSRQAEQAYYRKTGIFPIMHTVAVRRSLLEQHPQLAKAIFDAYSQAKTVAYRNMARLGWGSDMLPWYGQELEQTQAVMGANFYSYGLDDANRKVLETLFRYSHEQGLASRRLTVEEVFHPASLEFREA